MTQEQATAALGDIRDAMHARFDGARHLGRLEQLDYALATAGMAVDHLHDEQVRADHDKSERVRRAEAGE